MGAAWFHPITLFVYFCSWSPRSAAHINKERHWFKPNSAHKTVLLTQRAETRANFFIRVCKDLRAVSERGRQIASSLNCLLGLFVAELFVLLYCFLLNSLLCWPPLLLGFREEPYPYDGLLALCPRDFVFNLLLALK